MVILVTLPVPSDAMCSDAGEGRILLASSGFAGMAAGACLALGVATWRCVFVVLDAGDFSACTLTVAESLGLI